MIGVFSFGDASIECPQCQGDGLLERTIGGGGWPQEDVMVVCNVCTPEGRAAMHLDRGPGWLDLPLTPEIAARIYTHGNAAASELVAQAPERSDFPACAFAHRYDRWDDVEPSGAGRLYRCDYPECDGCAEYTDAVDRWDAAIEAAEVDHAA